MRRRVARGGDLAYQGGEARVQEGFMERYEYTVIPAPDRGSRAKGARTPTERYALALAEAINAMAADGWDYIRAETLPSDERSGIASRQTLWHNVLVFRRNLTEAVAAPVAAAPATMPEPEPAPEPPTPTPEPAPAPVAPAAPAKNEVFTQPPLRKKEPADEPAPPAGPRLGPAR